MFYGMVSKRISFIFGVFVSMVVVCSLASSKVVGPSTQGFNDETLSENFERYIDSWQSADQSMLVKIAGTNHLLVPWYKTSDSTSISNLKSSQDDNCHISGAASKTNFCMVTDEMSQYFLGLSMSQEKKTIDTYYWPIFSTIKSLASGRYGKNTIWKSHYEGDSKKLVFDSKDTAVDADSRFILTLWNLYHHPLITDANFKKEVRSYAASFCADYLRYAYVDSPAKSAIDPKNRNIRYWLAGGAAQTRNGRDDLDDFAFTYTGYMGDAAVAMMACYHNLHEQQYLAAARDTVEQYLVAAAWNSDTGLRFPDGRNGHWEHVQDTPRFKCDDWCDSKMDPADAPRAASLGVLRHIEQEKKIVINDKLSEFFSEWVGNKKGYGTKHYAKVWSTKGEPIYPEDTYMNNGLASYLDIGVDTNAFVTRQRHMGSKEFKVADGRFNKNKDAMGVYWPAFVINSLGIGIGHMDKTIFGEPAKKDESKNEKKKISNPPPINSSKDLVPSCRSEDNTCGLTSDFFKGSCRNFEFASSKGKVGVKACEKPDRTLELYRIWNPYNYDYQACFFNDSKGAYHFCITQEVSFVKINLHVGSPGTSQTNDSKKSDTQEGKKTTQPSQGTGSSGSGGGGGGGGGAKGDPLGPVAGSVAQAVLLNGQASDQNEASYLAEEGYDVESVAAVTASDSRNQNEEARSSSSIWSVYLLLVVPIALVFVLVRMRIRTSWKDYP